MSCWIYDLKNQPERADYSFSITERNDEKMKDNLLIALLCSSLCSVVSAEELWRGLVVEPENRCSPYDKKSQYPYSQSVEDNIVGSMGSVYGPYTGNYYESDSQTDIEHIVATSEAHDSGLCAASAETRIAFANDLMNLTLAAPKVNRCGQGGKCGLDAGEWLPERNKCWFSSSVVMVKQKYSLSVDRNETVALESVLSSCSSTEMIFYPNVSTKNSLEVDTDQIESSNALELYDDNSNGRITCSEARRHGISPVYRNHIAYEFMSDRDGDGVVCEN